jgi:hypothetical protein
VAVVLVLAAAEQRDRLATGAAAEGVDRLGGDLLPIAFHVPLPRQPLALEGAEQVDRRGDVSVPFVDLFPADAAGPEAHDQDAGAVGGFPRVIDSLNFHHLFL